MKQEDSLVSIAGDVCDQLSRIIPNLMHRNVLNSGEMQALGADTGYWYRFTNLANLSKFF